jgi:ubiquinone/menaquinone biosynthesis C-methylase UbiE
MKADFDNAASKYDATFTHTVIGSMQRALVYEQLAVHLKASPPKKILEINCGTGEDAIWLGKQHFEVIATDISEKMIEVAQSKTSLEKLRFVQSDMNGIHKEFSPNSFELILSNFGGLNCLAPVELATFFENIASVLKPNGKMILVIMPKNTIWEQSYFLLKMEFKKIFRRKGAFAMANVDGEKVKTYYYNPKDIVNLANTKFAVREWKPIGFFIPPSYLETFFKNKPKLISFLNVLEQNVKNASWLAKYADHYLIVLQKK